MDKIEFLERHRKAVRGVKLTRENLREVENWCDGEVRLFDQEAWLAIINQHGDTTVNFGDWVLCGDDGKFFAMSDRDVNRVYIPKDEVAQNTPSDARKGPLDGRRGPQPTPNNVRG